MLILCVYFSLKIRKNAIKSSEYRNWEPDHGRFNCKNISFPPKTAATHQQLKRAFYERTIICSLFLFWLSRTKQAPWKSKLYAFLLYTVVFIHCCIVQPLYLMEWIHFYNQVISNTRSTLNWIKFFRWTSRLNKELFW